MSAISTPENQKAYILTVRDLKSTSKVEFINQLQAYSIALDLKIGQPQINAWNDCYEYLLNEFSSVSIYDDCYLLLEYCLPFTNYRRPDVILLSQENIIVLEFKRKDISYVQDVDQLLGYLNFLRNYHFETHAKKVNVTGCLILTSSGENSIEEQVGFTLIKGKGLSLFLNNLQPLTFLDHQQVLTWANSPYEPLQNILKASYNMFKYNDLSMIKNINEDELIDTLSCLTTLTQNHTEKRLIFLTGVPGAGKTLALLHTLYNLNKENYKAIFLTGNGPLEKVLSTLLSSAKNQAFGDTVIKGVLAYKKTFFNKASGVPSNLIAPSTILFDEAQRAWDKEHMRGYNKSEPDLILEVQNKVYESNTSDHTNVVASIGFGQSIYVGEEKEFDNWIETVENPMFKDWNIYASSHLQGSLKHLSNVVYKNELHLDKTIRSSFVDVSLFVEAVLNNDTEVAKEELNAIVANGYVVHMTDDLNAAQDYLLKHSLSSGDKFYGLIASSNSRLDLLSKHLGTRSMLSQSATKDKIGSWYLNNSSRLEEIASEFVCQGLELNIPILYFGGDFRIQKGYWYVIPNKNYRDPEIMIKNIYRVLLTRGRLGIILYIPSESEFEETRKFFKHIGITTI